MMSNSSVSGRRAAAVAEPVRWEPVPLDRVSLQDLVIGVNAFAGSPILEQIRSYVGTDVPVLDASQVDPPAHDQLVFVTGNRVDRTRWGRWAQAATWVHFLSAGVDGVPLDRLE